MGARVFALGAHVGEVIRRQGEGHWHGNDGSGNLFGGSAKVRQDLADAAVMKRFKNCPEDGVYIYGLALTRE